MFTTRVEPRRTDPRALHLVTDRSSKRALGAVALGAAGYVGGRRGGLVVGWTSVFLAAVWIDVVPPLAALVRGDGIDAGGYVVPHPSAVGLNPRAELLTGLRIAPVVALVLALTLGSAAFALGAALRRRSRT
ncbi:MAG: hypothetical protein ACOCPY_01755 [Halorubrum sp.]